MKQLKRKQEHKVLTFGEAIKLALQTPKLTRKQIDQLKKKTNRIK